MDHANFRHRNRPQEYESPLVCLGPIYQSEPSRADHVERPPYAQKQPSCITTYRSQPSLRTAVKKALTAHEAQNTGPTSNRRPTTRAKRWSVLSACAHCRRRKTKCSGERPVCQFCAERGLTCEWDIPGGLTRNEDLRRKIDDAERYCEEARVLLKELQFGSIETATMLLAKLRLGSSLSDLAESVRTGRVDEHDLPHSV